MNYNRKLIIYTLLIMCFKTYITIGQTNELGLFIGGSFFHGDVGYVNAESSIIDSRSAIGFQFKRNFNYHFGLNLSFNKGELYANDAYSSDLFRLKRNLHFKSKITELTLISEFNFRPYVSRNSEYNRTPFIFAGITKYFFNPQTNYSGDEWIPLRLLTTEGQGSDFYPTREFYELNGIAIPFGFGYKFNVYDFITLNFHLSQRITFSDYIDDVSTTYIDEAKLNNLNTTLDYEYENAFPEGFQRGNPYSNDKYGFFGVSIIYSIKDPQKKCDNIVY